MPMERDDHESLLTELLNNDLEHSRKTEILQQLRVDYGTVHAEFGDITKTRDDLQKKHDDLIVSNSQLFRKLGTIDRPDKEKEVVEKEFSETVTIEQLEK
jgi:hypothetical protein